MKLENWQLHPGLYGVPRIHGNIFGSEKHEDGKSIRTSRVLKIEDGKVYTESGSTYELGKPAQSFQEYFAEKDCVEIIKQRVEEFYVKDAEAQKNYLRIKGKTLDAAWPCEDFPHRRYLLYRDDVLTKEGDGTYTKHSGFGMFGFIIPDDQVEGWDKPVYLEIV